MAEIPVERKSSFPWWLPLLALLGLILFGFLLMRGCDDRSAVVNNVNNNAGITTNTRNDNARITTQGVGTATGERVTDVNMFGTSADKEALAGRGVDLKSVKVNRVLSDRVFTVTSGAGEMFCLLDQKLDSGGGKEDQIKMRPGLLVNLGGTFQRVPDRETKSEQQGGGLDTREYAQMTDQRIYLHVNDVRSQQ